MFNIKRRYIFTKHNRLRLRYMTSALALMLTTGFASYAHTDRLNANTKTQPKIAAIASLEPTDEMPKTDAHVFVRALGAVSHKIDALMGAHGAAGSMRHPSQLSLANVPVPVALDGTETAEPAQDAQDAAIAEAAQNAEAQPGAFEEVLNKNDEKLDLYQVAYAIKKPEPPPYKNLEIGNGDTLSGTLEQAGVGVRDAVLAIRAMNKYFNPRHVKAGQKLQIETSTDDQDQLVLDKMILPINVAKSITVQRDGDGYSASVETKDIIENEFAKSVKIDSSLYASAARVGIPAQVIAELIRVYSWDVDFQRDIRSGDKVEVLYTVKETEDGEFAGYGNVSYASLSIGGHDRPIYRFKTQGGDVDYFEPNGRSIRKTLMKTPVDGARLSSGFGMRHHPVLGYNRMHKGVDFAAPTGTPIYAAGDGTIEYASRYGSFGNYVRIRHNGSLKTAYAHMLKFGKSIRKGAHVKQGQVIGYIGTTGRSTGPHLHYEVLKTMCK